MSNKDSSSGRLIWANIPELNKGFCDNRVSTTKYNLVTFLPLSLFIQFRRVSNIYFLITAILQSIPQISPLQPFTAIAPLVFVLGVSMIREGFEDYLRYKSDKEINNSPTMVYKRGAFTETKFSDISVGDLVQVKKDQTFPCDLVMLANANENGTGYIETSTLDGEKALKPRIAFINTSRLLSVASANRLANKINCEAPNSNLYNFKGNFESYEEGKEGGSMSKAVLHPLEKNHLLLAGAFLRNTDWALGIAVYTGVDTKLRMNMSKRKYKESQIEHMTNRYILVVIILQFCFCCACAVASGFWVSKNIMNHDYIRYTASYTIYNKGGIMGFLSYFTYFLLLNTMLPISLIVTLELLKLAQGFFMMFDKEMYSKKRDRCCKVSSFSLNEELGMIRHVFSDKTGTLTCNQMEFKFLSAGVRNYGEQSVLVNIGLKTKVTFEDRDTRYSFNDKNIENDLFAHRDIPLDFPNPDAGFHNQRDATAMALRCMALCHECIIEEEEGEIKYTGPSPDDVVLVDAARRIGYQLSDIKSDEMVLKIYSKISDTTEIEVYKRICIIEFNSDRKRMSVILYDKTKKLYMILLKGADNVVLERLANSENAEDQKNLLKYREKIKSIGTQFSTRGFRVLLMAFKYIRKKDFRKWKKVYDEAATQIDNRDESVAQAAALIEKDLYLIGCTAVEDALQDDVPDTINDLLKAGLSFWMLTGDKYETAENIGKTCTLIDDNMHVESCRATNEKDCYSRLKSAYTAMDKFRNEKESALIIEGASLKIVLGKPKDQSGQESSAVIPQEELDRLSSDAREEFLKISEIAKTVICCRMSPSDKKDVVSLIKKHSKAVTLSIGDGANDVPMILEAHIGVGLYGEEGIQAVQASDYALGEFRYLWELLLVHGRFNYIRQSEMILYFFYKNLVFTFPQFLFSHYCAYSGQTVYDDWYLTFYNLVFTALPLFVRALFEKDYIVPKRYESAGESGNDDKKNLRKIIPTVYKVGMDNQLFRIERFVLWLFNGILHAVVIFFIPLYASQEGIMNSKGNNYDLWSFSIASFTSIILIVNFKLGMNTKLWNKFHFCSMFGLSILLYFVFILIYDAVTYTPSFHTVYELLDTHYFYFCVIGNLFFIFTLDGALTVLTKNMFPTDSDVMANKSFPVVSSEGESLYEMKFSDEVNEQSVECYKENMKIDSRPPSFGQGSAHDNRPSSMERPNSNDNMNRREGSNQDKKKMNSVRASNNRI